MAILDIFKKKKKAAASPGGEPRPAGAGREKPKRAKEAPRIKAKKKPTAPLKPKKISEIAYRVLKEVHVTEKATDLVRKNQYIFKVFPRTNKVEIKKVVEDLYGVNVLNVKIINIPKKRRRLGRVEGWRKGYKKAIVKIKKGQKIEVLPR